MSFKLQGASSFGGRLAKKPINHHHQVTEELPHVCNLNVNAIFYVRGQLSHSPIQFLLDTGAAVSVVRHDVLGDNFKQKIIATQSATFGANGLPLEVLGQVTISVSLGDFNFLHLFIVVEKLSVPGILGADFLIEHKATINCNEGTLWLGEQVTLPLQISNQPQAVSTVHNVVALLSQEIPGCCAKLIKCKVKGIAESRLLEGLVEPLQSGTLLKHIMVGRSLNRVSYQQEIVIPSSSSVSYSELTDQEKGQIHKLLTEFSDVFASAGGPLGRTDIVKHAIHSTGMPIRQLPRRLPESLKPVVNTEVNKMLNQGVIRHSNSPWSSPIVMIQKKDGSWRFCIDYRKVNSMTQQDAYPLPRIDKTLDSLSRATYFTKLDLASGYWQVEMEEEDKKKTAFSTPMVITNLTPQPHSSDSWNVSCQA